MDKLNIQKVKSSKPHKVYSVNITHDSHIKDLCKFLRKQEDKKLEVIISGKRIVFSSVAERKKYAAGFECAFTVIEPYMEKYADDLHDKINKLTNEISTIKRNAQLTLAQLSEERENYRVKSEVISIRKAAYDDHLAEWKANCLTLQQKIKELETKNKPRPAKKRRRKRKVSAKDTIAREETVA